MISVVKETLCLKLMLYLVLVFILPGLMVAICVTERSLAPRSKEGGSPAAVAVFGSELERWRG